jgi:hypothetical protein
MERQVITIEHAFWLDDERTRSYNEDWKYYFDFPEDWRNIVNKDLSLTIRSITTIPAPRVFILEGIKLQKVNPSTGVITDTLPIDIHVGVPSKDGMTEINTEIFRRNYQLLEMNKEKFPQDAFEILYNYNDNTFHILTHKTDQFLFQIDYNTLFVSNDLLGWTNTKYDDWGDIYGLSTGSTADQEASRYSEDWYNQAALASRHSGNLGWIQSRIGTTTQVKGFSKILIGGLWGRERLLVKSGLDKYNEYLGYTNSNYGPPKTYKINNCDASFWIELHDAGNKFPVILPLDAKDTLVVETQLIAS